MALTKVARVLVALLAAALVVGLFWYVGKRLGAIEASLRQAESRAAALNTRIDQYSRELELAIERAQAAREQATQAQQRAEQEAAGRTEAESEAAKAHEQAQSARVEAGQAREELETVRRRREAELKRMQEALSKIAITRRTPSGMVVELADDSFHFDFDSAALRPENRELLSRIAGILLASEGYRLFVYGHTDDIGTEEYNQNLSERRAKSVSDYLKKAGLPADIISVKGFGKSSPVTTEKTREARARNRRVEIGIVDTIIHYGETVSKR